MPELPCRQGSLPPWIESGRSATMLKNAKAFLSVLEPTAS